MARTVKDIKDEMTAEFVSDSAVVEKYGLDTTKTFDEQFSKVSIESIIFYVFAFCAWTVEKLFDTHKTEVTNYIDEMKPHSLRWYVNKTKLFRIGQSLIEGTDQYSDEGLTEKEIEDRQIVKYAAASEQNATLYIKVAGSGPKPISEEQQQALTEYLAEIKDAGVRIVVRNANADKIKMSLRIFYNPMILQSNGNSLQGGTPVIDAIQQYVENLPFNGEFRKVDLVDALQQVEGVVMPELVSVSTSVATSYYKILDDAYEKPFSGYYEFDIESTTIEYIPYENVSY